MAANKGSWHLWLGRGACQAQDMLAIWLWVLALRRADAVPRPSKGDCSFARVACSKAVGRVTSSEHGGGRGLVGIAVPLCFGRQAGRGGHGIRPGDATAAGGLTKSKTVLLSAGRFYSTASSLPRSPPASLQGGGAQSIVSARAWRGSAVGP